MKARRIFSSALVSIALLTTIFPCVPPLAAAASQTAAPDPLIPTTAHYDVSAALRGAPLMFIGSAGQFDPAMRFQVLMSNAEQMPMSFIGSWRGSAVQTFPDMEFTISVTLVPARVGTIAGNIAYPSLQCGGELTLLSLSPTAIELLEDITYGDCVDLGIVRLTTNGQVLSFY